MATPTNLPAAQTTGNVLTAAYVNDLRGAFRILQVVAATPATVQKSSASAVYQDVGLSATITPQATSSKIFIIYSVNIYTDTATTGASLQLFRGATSIQTTQDFSYSVSSGISTYNTLVELDSPNTTSATTYTVYGASNANSSFAIMNHTGTPTSTLLLLEVSA